VTAPNTQRTTLEEALDHIAAEPLVWTRAAAVSDDSSAWALRLLELTSGPEAPPSWEAQTWEYPVALFTASAESGEALSEWLRTGCVPLAGRECSLLELAPSVMWERRQSRSPAPYERLEWPVTDASLSQTSSTQAEPQGHLVSGSGAPSFVNFYTAAACFFWLDRQPVGGSLHQGVMYRHQDARGRINHVRIDMEHSMVDVEVEGDSLNGMTVELAGDLPGSSQPLWSGARTRSDTVTFTLNGGLPPGAWVLLRHGVEWIDRRFLSVPWSRGQEAGIVFVVEPGTKLEAFLADREGPRAEFKRQVPVSDDAKAKVMKTVCAFANGNGGSLLFGIDDDHNVVGVPAARTGQLTDQLTQMVGSWVHPRPEIGFELLPTTDVDTVVLELSVSQGTALCGCGRPGEEVPVPYIRHFATSVRARPDEIEQIVRSRAPNGGLPPWMRW
jgi:hypothetical protein